jgi:membrane protein DedA with SNARE-associated domain
VNSLEGLFRSLGDGWGYGFLFLVSLVENLFPPMPGDTFTVLGAVLAGRGEMQFLPAYLSTTAGGISGFMICYAVGKRWGERLFHGNAGLIFSRTNLEKVQAWFGRYGYGVLIANRFLAGFRAVVAFGAGMARMHPLRVFFFAAASCFIWNAVLMFFGMKIGEHWSVVVRYYQQIVFAVLCLCVVSWWLKGKISRFRKQKHGQ